MASELPTRCICPITCCVSSWICTQTSKPNSPNPPSPSLPRAPSCLSAPPTWPQPTPVSPYLCSLLQFLRLQPGSLTVFLAALFLTPSHLLLASSPFHE